MPGLNIYVSASCQRFFSGHKKTLALQISLIFLKKYVSFLYGNKIFFIDEIEYWQTGYCSCVFVFQLQEHMKILPIDQKHSKLCTIQTFENSIFLQYTGEIFNRPDHIQKKKLLQRQSSSNEKKSAFLLGQKRQHQKI